MRPVSRRDFLDLALTFPAGLATAATIAAEPAVSPANLHEQILELAAFQEQARRPVCGGEKQRRSGRTRAPALCRRFARFSVISPTVRACLPSRRRARSRLTITWSKSLFSRVSPVISYRPCSTNPRRSTRPFRASSAHVATPWSARPRGRTRSCISTSQSEVTSS